ncbi:arylacetamide deacetylase-like 2 [Gracilinanus agilis]|uniref:arylacetamide deacetylase-like 2 n=1 Tax=Gracilinanus agilis TaxID=191870 RepID=UPI001CFED992|nr:arylacetamide deacetylase-like 2 [Gracilinanus agilis]
MGPKAVCLMISCALVAWHMHTTFSANYEEPWKIMIIHSLVRICQITVSQYILVEDESMSIKSFPAFLPYETFARWAANRLDAVVVAPDYQQFLKYHHPTQWNSVSDFVKSFLQPETLAKYGVDPNRVCITGDSSGATLAAAMTQQVIGDSEIPIKPKFQALIYPALQMLDTDLPSYRENEYGMLLPKYLAIKIMSEFYTTDESLQQALKTNQHIPAEYSHLFKFVNWSALLPERFKKGYVYTNPIYGSSEIVKKFPGIVDPTINPLLASDSMLSLLPLTYMLTCQHDVLRDDGLMYVTRLRNNGVQVFHEHIEKGFHGSFFLINWPFHLNLSLRLIDNFFSWVDENL